MKRDGAMIQYSDVMMWARNIIQKSIIKEKIINPSVRMMGIGEEGEYFFVIKLKSPDIWNTVLWNKIVYNSGGFGKGLGFVWWSIQYSIKYTVKVTPYYQIVIIVTGYGGEQLVKEVTVIIIWGIDVDQDDKTSKQLTWNNDVSPVCIWEHLISLKWNVFMYKDSHPSGFSVELRMEYLAHPASFEVIHMTS